MTSAFDVRLARLLAKPDLRILTVVRDHMSGLLYAVPALRALRHHFPSAHISLLANPYATPILEGCPYVDRILPFFQFRQAAGRLAPLTAVTSKARTWLKLAGRVDLVIHFRYVSGTTVAFCAALGRPFQIGYRQGKFDNLLDVNLGRENVRLGSRQRNALLLETLGLPTPSPQMEMWITPAESTWVDTFLNEQGWQPGQPLFALHPGCHWGCNEWLPARWSELGNALQHHYGGRLLITGAPDELELAQQIAQGLDTPPIIAAGRTTLRQFAALLARTSLVVAVDTAPTQICQALHIPSVILMGAGNPAWNGPLPGEPMVMLQNWDQADEKTMRCDFAAGTCHGPHCRSRLLGITVHDVLAAADPFLSPPTTISTPTPVTSHTSPNTQYAISHPGTPGRNTPSPITFHASRFTPHPMPEGPQK
jgi:ADP-heptose:LPS heptosyltransferase